MAGLQNTSSTGTRRFDKDLNEDVNDFHLGENQWTQARNAINNSTTGDLGKLGNEPSNLFCLNAPYTVIGVIHVVNDIFAIYSTDDVDSEIGLFKESTCQYITVVNARCLNFNRTSLIRGTSRSKSTCNFSMYWADGRRNPDRSITFSIDPFLNSTNAFTNPESTIPWIQNCVVDSGGCNICTNTPALNCEDIRLARFIKVPCIEALKGVGAGTLLNGSYMVAVAYAIDGQKISDWYVSNVQALFDHNNGACSLDVSLSNVDQDYDQLQVVLISVTNQQTVARLAGVYNTRQKHLSFDTIDNTWPAVPIENIPIMSPITEASDAIFSVGDTLIRVGPTSREDFNYQRLANQIVTKWQSVEYPVDYYRKGGNKTNYLRDEVYSFFIQWIYDTGDKSSSYHIPGRPGGTGTFIMGGFPLPPNDFAVVGTDADPEISVGLTPYNWTVYNTSILTGTPFTVLPDGGVVIAEGYMGYWESTETYPDNQPQIWNAGIALSPYNPFILPTNNVMVPIPSGSAHDLCGKPIRHHKFPDLSLTSQTQYLNNNGTSMRIMGVKFENIKAPVMNDGITPVPGIVGYEILRGTRNGNKTILAKGLVNNMRLYNLPNGVTSSRQGAFPNYPYNDLRADPFLSTTPVNFTACNPRGAGGGENNFAPQIAYSAKLFTFHSPDTNFTDPYLSAKEFKIAGEFNGDVVGKFENSEEHPKEKILTNMAFYIAAIAGIGVAGLAMNGQRTVQYSQPKIPGFSEQNLQGPGYTTLYAFPAPGSFAGTTTVTVPGLPLPVSPTTVDLALITTIMATGQLGVNPLVNVFDIYDTVLGTGFNLIDNALGRTGTVVLDALNAEYVGVNALSTAFSTAGRDITQEDGQMKYIPSPMRFAAAFPLFFNYTTQATDTTLELFRAVSRFRQFALRYHSHCLYDRYRNPIPGNTRRVISNSEYIGPQITDFGLGVRINNLYRAKTVAIETVGLNVSNPIVTDVTRIRASEVDVLLEADIFGNLNKLVDPTKAEFGRYTAYTFPSPLPPGVSPQVASSHYVYLKQRLRNQYGQINGVIQVPVSYCPMPSPVCTTADPPVCTIVSSDTLFGGDSYVGRYTEKNTFFFFYNWLYGEPDGAQFDYTRNEMIPHPRYWANFNQFETGDFTSSITALLLGFVSTWPPSLTALVLPNDFYNLDGLACNPGLVSISDFAQGFKTSVRDAYFYLFSSGVRDFYVESEINVDLRDWGALETEQHYDPYRYSDTKAIFDTKFIKAGNYYKYDQSLSVSKLWINYSSWAAVQRNNYNPFLAETCFIYTRNRLIYSLPAQYESLKDNWYTFLPNNYKDFLSKLVSIKAINKSGAILFFESQSPLIFMGLDQLQTTSGTSLTIGDGTLFSQPPQNIANADRPFEYASCQDGLSVINTPAGVFWISQNQGKIFNYSSGLTEISQQDLKWWFNNYLPYKLTETFPNFSLIDNPVIGIGCQSIYDNENSLLYFTKRDFTVRTNLAPGTTLRYDNADNFTVMVNNIAQFPIKLGDLRYFEDASWTVSYDPKIKGWISHHDWHPNLMIPGKNTFLTILGRGIWLHNERFDSFCNFYGVDYPFEVEYMVNTVQTVNTLRSVEYIMEAYKYDLNGYDRFHDLDYNFDEAVIYNTEQVSGLLRLVNTPKNNPQGELIYPIVAGTNITILYDKVENKYRFNQFWDITDDRGEFNPAAQRMIWNTGTNGYVRVLNPNNLNYNKLEFQRKKFRHYTNSVFLRKRVSGNKKILVMLTNNKNLYSPR